ncbi:MAG: hypothetical protein J6B68_01765 [Lachnospiraceae bacterium]|nr:hypothetical protein [Lachnospiraceae bacterium]MBP3477574.1 hypothetical protein [Lachnospiraceae bacterium]
MKSVMDITDAKRVIKDLQDKLFICGKYTIETDSGYVITTKSKRPYCRKKTNADRIQSMSIDELAKFLESVENAGYRDESIAPRGIDMLDWLRSEVEES